MSPTKDLLTAIPTNIITGFLGAGKTTLLLNLLKQKPKRERWAILVNEFGEVGVDGSLLLGSNQVQQQVFVKEVPGGCMCCTAGLPMQVALNQLLQQAKPDRLLVEPTGLGHPLEVIDTLRSEHYTKVIKLEKILTLVDARNLSDSRYLEHPTFQQQLEIADVLVGNKRDLYQPTDIDAFESLTKKFKSAKSIYAEHGAIDHSLLIGPTQTGANTHSHHHHHPKDDAQEVFTDLPLPESGYLKAVNQGEGYVSVGWRITPTLPFNRERLFNFLSALSVERAKGVFVTGEGVLGYNLAKETLTEIPLDDCFESRIEIIAEKLDDHWEDALLSCLES